jgi:hypothetical protein
MTHNEKSCHLWQLFWLRNRLGLVADRFSIRRNHKPDAAHILSGSVASLGVLDVIIQRHVVVGDDLGAIHQGGETDLGSVATLSTASVGAVAAAGWLVAVGASVAAEALVAVGGTVAADWQAARMRVNTTARLSQVSGF